MRLALVVLLPSCFIAPDRPGNSPNIDAPPDDVFTGPCTEIPNGVTLDVAETMRRPSGTGLIRAGKTTTDEPVIYFFEPRPGFSTTCATQSHRFDGGAAFAIAAVAPYNNTDILVLAVVNNLYQVRQLRIDGTTLVELQGRILSAASPSTIPFNSGSPDAGSAYSPFIAAKLGFVYFGGTNLHVGALPISGDVTSVVPTFTGDAPQTGQTFYNAAPLVNHGDKDFVMATPNATFTARGASMINFSKLATGACSMATTPNQCEGRVARAIYDVAPGAPRLAGVAATRTGHVEAYFDETNLYVGTLLADVSVGPRNVIDVAIDELTAADVADRFEVVLLTDLAGNRNLEIWRGAIGRAFNGSGPSNTGTGLSPAHTRIVTGTFDTMNRRILALSVRPNSGASDFCGDAMLLPCN